eukprot:CAMPEP_0206135762 /NCGR_PEP_ID=MMETSP1473-20131121/1030_1 /ASSEMBLY_ACC=CAM_ASM_001109 /TAXON_ID=1461547 /ORGANISM="Stichococcus sp, Strain RCC1054" /LENGTH=393 /DNA_ID=CAMNT_0053527839 /DNA_START=159 /DNA_END=1343 /DNA_ORIENTATION=+
MQHLAASAVLRAAVAAPSGIQPATSTALEALHCLSRQSGCISTLLPPVTRGLASAADDLSRSSLAACDGPELRRLLRPAGLQSMLPAARIATALSSAAANAQPASVRHQPASTPLQAATAACAGCIFTARVIDIQGMLPPAMLLQQAGFEMLPLAPPTEKGLGEQAKGMGIQPYLSVKQVAEVMTGPNSSPGQLADPYPGKPKKLPLFRRWFTPDGWSAFKNTIMDQMKNMYTINSIKKRIKGWTARSFKGEIIPIYEKVNDALAKGDTVSVREFVTFEMWQQMKQDIQQRTKMSWKKVDWALSQPLLVRDISVVHARIAQMNPEDSESAYAQLTVRINSMHVFAAYGAKGRVMMGDPAQPIKVVDLWVFERSLSSKKSNKWRVAARLDSALA